MHLWIRSFPTSTCGALKYFIPEAQNQIGFPSNWYIPFDLLFIVEGKARPKVLHGGLSAVLLLAVSFLADRQFFEAMVLLDKGVFDVGFDVVVGDFKLDFNVDVAVLIVLEDAFLFVEGVDVA